MTDKKDTSYDINFFRPKAGIPRASNRIITLFIVIWFIAVFGFQFLLIATNKMTPEDTLISFNEVWPSIQSGEATPAQQKEFSISMLMVLGKNIAVADADKAVVKEALSMTVAKLVPAQATDPASVAAVLELEKAEFGVIMSELLPYSLVATEATSISPELPGIMEKYCTHPQGPFTNSTFLGFPFHYWYTAQLLLIIFVLLCLAYALGIEKLYRKHNFVEEHN